MLRTLFCARSRVVGGVIGGTVIAFGLERPAECETSIKRFFSSSKADWPAIKTALEELYEDESAVNPSVDGAEGSTGGGGFVAPMMVRLAWHSAGSFKAEDGSGGTEGGTIRFTPEVNHGGNAGLVHALKLLEPIKSAHPAASWADIIVYAGTVAIESMGGPEVGFRSGRQDAPKPDVSPAKDKRFTPDDRLPAASEGAQHLRDVFYRMGFNDREIVCLSGAHAVGRCHTDRSGFWGPWKYGENAFSNEYFVLLLGKAWTPKKTHNGKPWTGPLQYEAEDGALMMLPTDMVLISDAKFRPHVELYAADEELFFSDFAMAFQKLLELGCKVGISA